MSNGFVIANARNYQKRLVMRGFWAEQERQVFLAHGPGDPHTPENFHRIQNNVGTCPFTVKMLVKRGWPLAMFARGAK